jgi:quercetin dioxygenase-like cupin family protein
LPESRKVQCTQGVSSLTAEFEVIDSKAVPELDGHGSEFTRASAGVRTRYSAPSDFGQFVAHGVMQRGATLQWDTFHGDEAVFVLAGDVRVDGSEIGPKGSVVIEADLPAVLEATTETGFVHVGSTNPGPYRASVLGPPSRATRSLHVNDPGTATASRYEFEPIDLDGVTHEDVVNTAWYTDGTCPGCRIAFFRVWGDGPHRGRSHSHSAHELITVTAGEIQVGRDRVEAGMTLAIPANRRYSFRASAPWEFINYRSDASYMTTNPDAPPVFDGALKN